MKMYVFARRCAQEILRDPLNLLFGLGFPIVVLLLLTAIQSGIPVPLFELPHLTPGITVFGLSFLTLFSATLLARDRESAFLQRLYTTPLRSADFILGYMLPIVPLAMAQCAVCYGAAIILGLPVTVEILPAILAVLPMAVFHISLGLLCGSIFSTKQVGGVCGALLTNLSAWLSGVWFDLDLVGGIFQKAARCLPFFHAVELERAIILANYEGALAHLLPVLFYAAVTCAGAILLFLRQMKKAH